MEQCCGTCQHHKDRRWPSDWTCTNGKSKNHGNYTEWEDWCEQYEEKKGLMENPCFLCETGIAHQCQLFNCEYKDEPWIMDFSSEYITKDGG